MLRNTGVPFFGQVCRTEERGAGGKSEERGMKRKVKGEVEGEGEGKGEGEITACRFSRAAVTFILHPSAFIRAWPPTSLIIAS
jgi:hypothetical protein